MFKCFLRSCLRASLLTTLLASLPFFTNAAPIGGCTSIINNDQNYLFCESPKSWPDARTFCAMNGGDLISIMDVEESDWVTMKRNETNTFDTATWINLETNNLIFWNWNIMSPSGIQNINCAKLLAFSNVIEDMSCNVLLNFICEIPYTSSLTTIDHTYTTTAAPMPYDSYTEYYQPVFIFFCLLIIILLIMRVQMRRSFIHNQRISNMPQTTMSPPIQLMENNYVKQYAKPSQFAMPNDDSPAYSVPTDEVPTYEVPHYTEINNDDGNYEYLDVIVFEPNRPETTTNMR